MEIRTLRYFLAVAREENMTRAAALLHVTQPTLSKQLRSLENELGKKLFLRHSFSIQLTEEGILLRKRAEDLVKMADKIANEFMSLDDVTGGDVYFGLAESYQIRFLANAINTFKKTYPGLRYHITSGNTEQVIERLDKGKRPGLPSALPQTRVEDVPGLEKISGLHPDRGAAPGQPERKDEIRCSHRRRNRICDRFCQIDPYTQLSISPSIRRTQLFQLLQEQPRHRPSRLHFQVMLRRTVTQHLPRCRKLLVRKPQIQQTGKFRHKIKL